MSTIRTIRYDTAKYWLMSGSNWEGFSQTFQSTDPRVYTDADGRKLIRGGTIWPANDATALGIVLQDIDVTDGDGTGSVVTKAWADEAKLTAINTATTAAARHALPEIKFFNTATTKRPNAYN